MDIHNKLAVGPRSVNSVGANHLLLQIWLTMVAMCETMLISSMSSRKSSSHSDFKLNLERALVKRAMETDVPEEAGTRTKAVS